MQLPSLGLDPVQYAHLFSISPLRLDTEITSRFKLGWLSYQSISVIFWLYG